MVRRKALQAGLVAVLAALAWLSSASAEPGKQATSVSHGGGSTSWAEDSAAAPAPRDRSERATREDGGGAASADTAVDSTGEQSTSFGTSAGTTGSDRAEPAVGQADAVRGAHRGTDGTVHVSRVTGGDSLASSDAGGGGGGAPKVSSTPVANSGDSGDTHAESSATNTGNTGPAQSTAESNPVSTSGDSGGTGETGSSDDQTVRNTGRSGRVAGGRTVVGG